MILVAFAIQFGSVGAGLAASVTASSASLRLCEGGLLPMLWAEAALGGVAAEGTGPGVGCLAADAGTLRTARKVVRAVPPVRRVSPVQLPIPPPSAV